MSNAVSPRPLSSYLLALALAAGATVGVLSPSVARADDDACTTTKFHYAAVENACKTGGRKAAKQVMKAAVQKAKAAGTELKCTSCHEDMKSFKLKDNAVKDMKPWI